MAKIFIPRPWQIPAIHHIMNYRRCALWSFLGSGKSSATLAALQRLSLVEDVWPVLVIAPLRVARDGWPAEAQKWSQFANLKISPVTGDLHERMAALKAPAHIYTVNYDQLIWLVNLYGKQWPFKTVVIDEATRLKTTRIQQGGKRGGKLYSVRKHINRVIELTGTPSPRGLDCLYGQMLHLDEGERLGHTYESFTQRWFQRSWEGYGVDPLPHAQAEIQDRLKDICLSIRARDWFNLADPIATIVPVTLPPDAMKLYKQMEKEMFITIQNEGIEATSAAGKRNKCSQLAQGAAYINDDNKEWKVVHDEKISALESIIEEANGATVLVAYHYKSDLARLKKAFPSGVNLADKEGMKKFKAGRAPIGFAHPASIGHGVDGLQDVTNILVYFAHDDNLENHLQILERIGPVRQMQSGWDRNVFVYHIVAKNTVEEYAILPNLQGKGKLQDLLLEAMRKLSK